MRWPKSKISMPVISSRLKEILRIRPSETGMVVLVTSLMFFALAGGAIGSPGIEALFFSRFGVQFLPHMYVALGLVIVATSLGFTALLGRLDRERLYVVLPVAMAAILLGARILLSFDFNWFYPPLWLGMNVFWALLNLFTWGLAGMVCDTRQAKRLFPLFGAAGILGLAAGGLVTRPLVELLGTENLLLVWAASLLLAFSLSHALVRFKSPETRPSHRRTAPLLAGVKQGYHFARRSALIRWMALAAVLFAMLYYSVVFPFSRAVAAEFQDEDALTAFLGVFQGLSMGATFLTSLFVANRLYARFGFMTAIFAYPLLYFFGFSALAISAVFPVLVVFRFSQLLWSEAVSEGANHAMYNLVPLQQREQTRAFVRGIANPAGISLVGGVLLAGERLLPPASIYLVGMIVAAVTAYLVWRARGTYSEALVESLRAGQPHLFFSEEEPFGGFRRDATALKSLLDGISNPDVVVRRVSAEVLANLADPEMIDTLLSALDDEDPSVRAALLRAIARTAAASATPEVVAALQDPDSQVRLEAVHALRQLTAGEHVLVEHLQPLLKDPDPAIRGQAAASLLSSGPHPQAERVIRDQATRGDLLERVAALKALVKWGSQSAYDIAAAGLNDPQPAIRAVAATILARIDARQCVASLVTLLGDADGTVRRSAAQALGKIGMPALEPVVSSLFDGTLESGALMALQHLPVRGVSESILSYARKRSEEALYYHDLWLASATSNPGNERLQLLSDSLRSRSLDYGANALKAIALLRNTAGISLALENLDNRNAEQRANALETLESLGKPQLVKPLIVLWEPQGRSGSRVDGWLVRVLQDQDPWLRACAALAASDAADPRIRSELAHLVELDPDQLVRATARKTLSGEFGMKTLQTLSLMERILFLRRVPLFTELPPADLKQIASITGEHLFAGGELIAEEGEIGEEMYIIVSGDVRVIAHAQDGKDVEIVRRGPGEYVGEMSIISREPRMASLVAGEQVRVLCIEQAEFEELLRLRPETSLAVMRVLCQRLKEPARYPV